MERVRVCSRKMAPVLNEAETVDVERGSELQGVELTREQKLQL